MIGDKIRRALKNKGMTSKALAEKVGVTTTYISYLLNDKRTASFETLDKICAVLDVSLSDLCDTTIDLDYTNPDLSEEESDELKALSEAIIKAINKASPNKKIKILKIINLINDEH